jgi:hypothetical protein
MRALSEKQVWVYDKTPRVGRIHVPRFPAGGDGFVARLARYLLAARLPHPTRGWHASCMRARLVAWARLARVAGLARGGRDCTIWGTCTIWGRPLFDPSADNCEPAALGRFSVK